MPSLRWTQALTGTSVLLLALTSGAASTTIPFEVRDGMPYIHVKVAGREIPVLFDLGDSSSLRLLDSALKDLGAKPTGTGGKIIQAQGGPVDSPHYQLGTVEFGRLRFESVRGSLLAYDPSYAPNLVGQAGYLGTGLLKPYVVRIDYGSKTLQLLAASELQDTTRCRGVTADFVPEWRGEAVTRVTTDLGELTLWWDTGASDTMLSRQFLERAHPDLKGDELQSKLFRIGAGDFGPRKIQIWDANLPPGFQGFVGRDFLEKHVVCIDYPSKRVIVER